MDSDLEKELTCSICTEILYQPLTLLDCLHTFCGSCVKDWFTWQRSAADSSPNPPSPRDNIFTCPSCRAKVRDTRHSATFASLVDMYLTANPDKAKAEEDKVEMRQKYKPGDNVLPKAPVDSRSPEDRRTEELDRRMIEQARELSLQDAGIRGSSEHRRPHRRRENGTPPDSRSRSARPSSRDARGTTGTREHSSRPEGRRRRTDSGNLLSPDATSDERQHRHRRSESRQRSPASSTQRRAIEHQASIRSLISSSDVDSRDLEREIEDFARQIQEEGLLDGLDLDNIDLMQNDELSQKVTEAYRRRQRERPRQERARRATASSSTTPRNEPAQGSSSRHPATETIRQSSRQRSSSANERPTTSSTRPEDRTRPPLASTHLEVHGDGERRRRRRNSSGASARSATDPVRPREAEMRGATRSSTDLTTSSRGSDPIVQRPVFADNRSNSLPSSSNPASNPGPSFSMRASAAHNTAAQNPQNPTSSTLAVVNDSGTSTTPEPIENSARQNTRQRPSDIRIVPQNPLPSLGLIQSPTGYGGHQRSRSQYYQEPSITCARCSKPHIEYELHYNCSKCSSGNWNICLDCYRSGKGCLHWFGFGYTAFKRWEQAQAQAGGEHFDPPHMLTSNRYRPPRSVPGGADGRRTMTTEDPMQRFESGMFCSRCFSWSNECYWRCDSCNEGDWGFCNNCVNQGYSCTHPLLPLTYVKPANGSAQSPPTTPPRSPRRPLSAQLFTGPNALSIGNFKPLTFTTTCDICRDPIAPTQSRHHCFHCTSTVVPDTQPGDYDICVDCHNGLVRDGRISEENGPAGWRRCLNGHRMAAIGFEESRGAQRRLVVRDIVGGRDLKIEAARGPDGTMLQKWRWMSSNGKTRVERLVTIDASATAPPSTASNATDAFPPDGGVGQRAVAGWSWYPAAEAEDELMFPRGAEIREVHDINGDWFSGSYMGNVGLIPSPFVSIIS